MVMKRRGASILKNVPKPRVMGASRPKRRVVRKTTIRRKR